MVNNYSGKISTRRKIRKKIMDVDGSSSDSEATRSSTCCSARKSSSESEASKSEQAASKSRNSLDTAQKSRTKSNKRDESSRESNLVITEAMKSEKAAASEARSDDVSTKQKILMKSDSNVTSVEKAHQKKWRWYDRGVKIHQAEKFRKGACANCGSMTHDAKSCFERARKVGAKFTGKHIAADDKIESFELDYAGKRDRWNGYDISQYCSVQDKKFEDKRMARLNYLMKQKPEEKICNEDAPGDFAVNYDLAIPKSKWEEDIYVNKHTSVWGSHWENHQWGYKCCLQTDKNSFCRATHVA